jgi:ABC-2 type transport system permease protein/sodium transport system permease protein
MPLLLYPLLGMVLRLFPPGKLTTESVPRYRLGFLDEQGANMVERHLFGGEELLIKEGVFVRTDGSVAPGAEQPPTIALPLPQLKFLLAEDLEQELRNGNIEVGIRPNLGTTTEVDTDVHVGGELVYLEDSSIGREAVRHIQRLYSAGNLRALLWKSKPRVLHTIGVVPTGGPKPSSFLVLMPLILILMTITGAVYPAIDLTAGERERGTLEILMAAPVPRLSLLLAKYAAVVTVAVLTALVNLAAMALTLWVSGFGPRLLGSGGLGMMQLLEIFLLLLLFAAFFSAVLLALTSFARSFKEAQAYLIPLMLLALVPGVMSLVPGLHLNGILALLPLLNIVLLARDLLLGVAEPVAGLVVIISTALYAVAAVAAAAAVFGAQAVDSGKRSWFGRRASGSARA